MDHKKAIMFIVL